MFHKVKILSGSGGFGTLLSKYVEEPVDGNPLWTANFLALDQEKCALVHRDFVKAGAEIVTTSTYQASVDGYENYLGLEEGEALQLIKDSVRLVQEGRKMAENETGKKYSIEIAGAVGPYGAFLHDGSEYTGSYCENVTEELLIAWHRPRITALVEAGVDILGFETVPCIKEALALLKLLKEFPLKMAWLSFSIKDCDSISSGEKFCEAAAKCWETSNQLLAVGANCFKPSLVTPLFKPLRELHPHIPTVILPNSGEKYDPLSDRWLDEETVLPIDNFVSEWLDIGISIIGACCRTNDKDIRNISRKVKDWEEKRAKVA